MKTTRLACRVIALLSLALALPAGATFHLWRMTEIYSTRDGKIQFVELATTFSGEQFLSNHTIDSTPRGGTTSSFTFTTDLPGDSGGKTFLIGTEGFAALGVLTPDYIVPNGFFAVDGGTVNFAGVDVWDHPAFPVDPTQSFNRDNLPGLNSPQNFAGKSTVLPAAALALNFQALWWKAPAGSESGWGVNITHQGDILFATWFTYDTDGSGMWLVIPDAHKTANNKYSGALYRTTGPAFSAVPFPSSSVVVTPLGTATFTFTDADNGTFDYSVGAVTQSKAITRQVYSVPASNCAAGTMAGTRQSFQDLWWRAPAGSESGWGVNISHQGDIIFATWFTYDAAGHGLWLVIPDARLTAPGTYAGPIYRTTGPVFSATPWNKDLVTVTPAGTATFTFSDGNTGTFAYTVGSVSQSKAIVRQAYSVPLTVCH